MNHAELTLSAELSSSFGARRGMRILRVLLPLAVVALVASIGYRAFEDSAENTNSTRLTASYVEVQTTFLLYAADNGESMKDACSRLDLTLARARGLESALASNPVLQLRAVNLIRGLEGLLSRCASSPRGLASELARVRNLARDLTASLGVLSLSDLGRDSRQAVSYPMPAPNTGASRSARL